MSWPACAARRSSSTRTPRCVSPPIPKVACRTKLNELGHWTGHVSRLDRNFSGRFGGEAHAREELVAELCTAFLCAELGVAPSVRHADDLGAWLEVLKGDNRAIFQAASLASKAADFVMGRRDAGKGIEPSGS